MAQAMRGTARPEAAAEIARGVLALLRDEVALSERTQHEPV